MPHKPAHLVRFCLAITYTIGGLSQTNGGTTITEPQGLPYVIIAPRPPLLTDLEISLRNRLDGLASDRLSKEMSDDFAYSNGSIRKIDTEMAAVRAQLNDLLNKDPS